MESVELVHLPNPWEKANPISKLFFSWMVPFFIKGSKQDLDVDDLYKCPEVDRSETLGDELQRQWDKEMAKLKKGLTPSLFKAIVRMFGSSYICLFILCLIEECVIRVVQPLLLGFVVRYFSHPESLSILEAYLCAGGVCLFAAFYIFTHHPYFFGTCHVGMKIRVACCSLIYRKALKLSRASLGRTTVGQMVNLLSNDVNRFDASVIFFPYLVVGPLQAATIAAVLWQHLGPSCLVGLSVLLLYVPFQAAMGRLFSKLRIKTAILTDERVRLMSELVSGMRVWKMYTWESPFASLVMEARRREVRKIQMTAILRGVNMSLFYVSSKVILFLCFLSFVLSGYSLTAEAIFVSMALFNNLRLSMTLFFPYGVAMGSETMISIGRLQEFLLLEELTESPRVDRVSLRPPLPQCGIWIHKLTATWNKDLEEPTLHKISVSVQPGELLAVVGPVGAGKTSFLMSILGELPVTSGDLKIRGKVAYASQEPWSFSGNVRQNVTFGAPMVKERYRNVMHVCALEKDLLQLPYGDKTLVGERGVSLSGGQKARMNLARALYYDADIYLLDDPLSAVDSAVAKHIFQKCITGYLRDKVRVLVTHQLQFIKQATKILVLKNGKCLALGSYQQLAKSRIDFVSLMEELKDEKKEQPCIIPTVSRKLSLNSLCESNAVSPGVLYESTRSISSAFQHEDATERLRTSVQLSTSLFYERANSTVYNLGDEQHPFEVPKQEEEMRTMGSVKGDIYWKYIRSGAGAFLIPVLVISNLLAQALFNSSDFWLSLWANNEERKNKVTVGLEDRNSTKLTNGSALSDGFVDWFPTEDNNLSIYIYTALVGSLFLVGLVRTITFFIMCVRASVNLHNSIFHSITRAPISFFDNNPVGPILNRFSRDLGLVDDLLPPTAFDCLEILLNLVGNLVVVAVVNYWIIIPTLILAVCFCYLRRFYIKTARDVKRLEGITRSPVFSHLSTSLYGLATIRAFNAQQAFESKFDHQQNEHSAAWFVFMAATRWLGIVLDWFCFVYITTVTMSLMVVADSIPGGNAGLAIASALVLTGMFQWGVRQSAEVESQMTSVERILEYTKLPSEAALKSSPDKMPPPNWPHVGAIAFENVSLYYNLNDLPVLKNLTFSVKPEEKVGIVGRTGAGKSSLIAALFRMTEPEGIIRIDGIDIKEIGLHDLRKKISIIPQDPVLFTGPVRRNLDPFGTYEDSQLWTVLEQVRLKEAVQELPGGLDTQLSEGGSNFSVGQRQLVCLARAILRQNRILVLDEATANVDPRTDSLIQRTIREKFAHCTVLTIAHRLNTIMDSDRVLVLDAGQVKEFDEPYNLLSNKSTLFSEMVRMTGRSMAASLHEVAKRVYFERHRETNLAMQPTEESSPETVPSSEDAGNQNLDSEDADCCSSCINEDDVVTSL